MLLVKWVGLKAERKAVDRTSCLCGGQTDGEPSTLRQRSLRRNSSSASTAGGSPLLRKLASRRAARSGGGLPSPGQLDGATAPGDSAPAAPMPMLGSPAAGQSGPAPAAAVAPGRSRPPLPPGGAAQNGGSRPGSFATFGGGAALMGQEGVQAGAAEATGTPAAPSNYLERVCCCPRCPSVCRFCPGIKCKVAGHAVSTPQDPND